MVETGALTIALITFLPTFRSKRPLSGCRGGNGVSRFKRSETESQPASLQQGDVHSY